MNPFQLVLTQMRQRALSTWLTLLSVILGAALAVSVLILRRESTALFAQSDFGYDILVGAKGSPMQLVLNTAYHIDKSPGNIPYIVLEALRNNPALVKHAVPYIVGDTYHGMRVAGTTPALFGFDEYTGKPLAGYDEKGHLLPGYQAAGLPEDERDANKQTAASVFEIRVNKKFTLNQGRMFHPRKFEGVIGADVTARSGLKMGDKFKVAHDAPPGKETELDEHDEEWTVVGVLDKTYTAEDRVVYVPLVSYYAIPQHESAMDLQTAMQQGEDLSRFGKDRPLGDITTKPTTGPSTLPASRSSTGPTATGPATTPTASAHHDHDHEEAYEMTPDGLISLKLPKSRWMLSAVLVRTQGGQYSTQSNRSLQYIFRNSPAATAVSPAEVMREFFNTFLSPTTLILLVIAFLVVLTAAVSILVSIYNAVSARAREIAIMRALGATRGTVLFLICFEAGLIGLIGGIIGMGVGHGLGAIESSFFVQKLGQGINWINPGWEEWVYLGGVVVVSVLAGLVPGLKAYRTPVATNLVSG